MSTPEDKPGRQIGSPSARTSAESHTRSDWMAVLDMLRQTDFSLYSNIARKMLSYLSWTGVKEATELLGTRHSTQEYGQELLADGGNSPVPLPVVRMSLTLSEEVFRIASQNLSNEQILDQIRRWIREIRLGNLTQTVNRSLPLGDVAEAIRRYHHLTVHEPAITSPSRRGLQIAVIRRLLSDRLSYIQIAKQYIDVADLYNLLKYVIFSADSHGRLGGKSAGIYLAKQILKKQGHEISLLAPVKTPRTWHLSSDLAMYFMHYNDLDDIIEQKYKDIHQVRLEYPHLVQIFKNAQFPPDMVRGLAVALDDFGTRPLIVRSSSLLEDQIGTAFSGKYKSLFLANQGTKADRLKALLDAVAEVYASTFSPDPIEYRVERGLLDYKEEMGIMVQAVVGQQIGKYFLPPYAGVAFSRNEFRWSPRIARSDGLLRMVMGLGTRAVDRVADDYPVLIAPGQPALRANVTPEDAARYSPHFIDVINLEANRFETLPIDQFLRDVGEQVPAIEEIVSLYRDGRLLPPGKMGIDFSKDDGVVTFEGLVTKTPFLKQVQAILQLLEKTLGTPVDIEFAYSGKAFYLLQCRPQSYGGDSLATPIPHDIPAARQIFSARRFVSNGLLPDIPFIVYVDPDRYANISDHATLTAVGRAVGRLNQALPHRQFILMGPGRWGSRGDIRLGVSFTYSDIHNTAMLIEIARKKGSYIPDLSFGTHFFQDLVESGIRYLPLYPDDEGVVFNEAFLTQSSNKLADFAPEFAHLSDTVRVIDVRQATDGMILQVVMNADSDTALAYLDKPEVERRAAAFGSRPKTDVREADWKWRLQMAEKIASELDLARFGVAACWVYGSTKNATAGPHSDIDLIVQFRGSTDQRRLLEFWLDGWNSSLSEINYQRTGFRVKKIVDVQLVSDEEVARKTGHAARIDAMTDPARPLAIRRS
ncbi:MAG: pyruvate, phosphate dikinase [candidate division Zixibacteria bacterium]|nr:pyruvate, phosphate dikinase [candidate division Zixibacteria bacterium]